MQKQLLDFPPLNALQDCFGADCMLSTWGSVILWLGHEVLRVSTLICNSQYRSPSNTKIQPLLSWCWQCESHSSHCQRRLIAGGILGRRKGWRSLETCLWCRCSWSGIMLWLVKCLQSCRQIRGAVDSIALSQDHAPTIRKKIFSTRISSKQFKFLCEAFRLSLGSKKSKKNMPVICCKKKK